MAPAERLGPEDEKLTVNVGPVDLGRVDLLVSEGLFSSRSDFIRSAIRSHLEEHAKFLDDTVSRRELTVGYLSHSKKDFERLAEGGERLSVNVVGLYRIDPTVTLPLAQAVLEDVVVLGSLRASKEVVAWIKSMKESRP